MDLADTLTDAGINLQDSTLAIAAQLQEALHQLLVRAQDAAAVRTDVTVADLHALAVGAVAAERRNTTTSDPTEPGRLTRIICDGLRISGATT